MRLDARNSAMTDIYRPWKAAAAFPGARILVALPLNNEGRARDRPFGQFAAAAIAPTCCPPRRNNLSRAIPKRCRSSRSIFMAGRPTGGWSDLVRVMITPVAKWWKPL